jgi:hypothetical protein
MYFFKFLALTLTAQSLTDAKKFNPEWRSVSTFPAGGYLESIVVRPNGDILTTHSFVKPGVWTVRNPSNIETTTSALIAPINSIAVLWGITEVPGLDEETYVIVGGNFSSFTPTTAIEGTEKAFKLVFPKDGGEPVIEEAANVAAALALNGLTAAPKSGSGVLIADSLVGSAGYLDLKAKTFDQTAIAFPEMSPVPDTRLVLGAGSVKYQGKYLYFSNAVLAAIYRVTVDAKGMPKKGSKPELVADLSSLIPGVDDFVFGDHNDMYLTTNMPGNALVHLDIGTGKGQIVLSGEQLADCSSLAFGRGVDDKNVLYISRGRSFTDATESASVVAVEMKGLKPQVAGKSEL